MHRCFRRSNNCPEWKDMLARALAAPPKRHIARQWHNQRCHTQTQTLWGLNRTPMHQCKCQIHPMYIVQVRQWSACENCQKTNRIFVCSLQTRCSLPSGSHFIAIYTETSSSRLSSQTTRGCARHTAHQSMADQKNA